MFRKGDRANEMFFTVTGTFLVTELGIELPKTIKAKIVETQPMVKGSTASASYKPATLENGVTVLVPPFVGEGEEIIVDPTDNRYIERAK